MAIYDCFQYFNEDHILDLRFNILDHKVDYFIVSESTKTHQGDPKKLFLILTILKNLSTKLNMLLQTMKKRLILRAMLVENLL